MGTASFASPGDTFAAELETCTSTCQWTLVQRLQNHSLACSCRWTEPPPPVQKPEGTCSGWATQPDVAATFLGSFSPFQVFR